MGFLLTIESQLWELLKQQIVRFIQIRKKTDRIAFDMKLANQTPRWVRIHLKRLLIASCAWGCFGASSGEGSTTTLTFDAPSVFQEIDHHNASTWRLDDVSLQPNQATGSASLSFAHIRNSDSYPNVLHPLLLDTTRFSGVGPLVEHPKSGSSETDLAGDLINLRYHADPNWLVANRTMIATTYTPNFTRIESSAFSDYVAHGDDLALGLNRDCHYFTDGLVFSMNLTAVPEVASLTPILGLIAVAAASEMLRRRRRLALAKIERGKRSR